jgi:hypothetical protein
MTDLVDRSSADVEAPEDVSPDDIAADVAAPAGASPEAEPFELTGSVRAAFAALLASAALIHLVMVPSHWGESAVEGVGFLASGWLQLALAVGLLVRPARWILQLVVLANVALVGVWIVSRTAGLPFGEHAGHAESLSIVDGTAVAVELAAVALALQLLLRPFGFLRTSSRALGFGVPIAALLMTSAAIASPEARNHASGSHGDHGAMGHDHGAAGDDRGLSQLTNGHQHGQVNEELDDATQAELAVQLSGSRALVERYPTVADAEAAGYTQAGPFTPGLGTHYSHPDINTADENGNGLIDGNDVERPLLIFDGTEPDSPIAGFMYYIGGQAVPEGFAGPNDNWHYHTGVCIIPQPDGSIETPFADDQGRESACNRVDGQWLEVTGNMVHVWSVPSYESELGVFNEINPALTCPDGTYYQIPLEDSVGRDSTCRNT